MRPSTTRQEEGQVTLALLLAVVAVLFVMLLFAQVGSAADQKTQARTVADAAAVAATQNARDARVSSMSRVIPHSWAPPIFAVVPPLLPRTQAEACGAAQRNWQANPHDSAFSCSSHLTAGLVGDGVRIRVRTPAGEVVDGPADASSTRFDASAHARVVLDRCPTLLGARGALARWLTDRTVTSFGSSSRCYRPVDAQALRALDLKPWRAPAAIGDPRSLLRSVRNATRVEIIE